MDNVLKEHEPKLQALVDCVKKATGGDGLLSSIASVWISNSSKPTLPAPALFNPLLCVVAQGSKEVWLGDESYTYDPAHFLLTSVTIPASGRVAQASPERPYLGITIELQPAVVESVIVEAGLSRPTSPS
ncbi:AraC family transcriptional regulator, partial [bacterium]